VSAGIEEELAAWACSYTVGNVLVLVEAGLAFGAFLNSLFRDEMTLLAPG
jgi:hypothetical protein